MQKYSKALGAALGGGLVGTGMSGVMLPEGSPWYAYVLLAAVSALAPALAAFLAPKNAA